MSKLGGRSYPGDLKPKEAVRWMEILVEDFNGETNQKETFARAVGHKSTDSGTFRRKLADARRYQLMAPRGDYRTTPLGQQLARPHDSEDRCEAVVQMLRNVDLIKEIDKVVRKEGGSPEEFWRVLTEVTDASPEEAKKVADWIEDLHKTLVAAQEVLQGKRTIDETEIPPPDEDHSESSVRTNDTERISQEGLVVKAGGDELRFGKLNDKNIEIAKQFLESMKRDGEDGYQSRL